MNAIVRPFVSEWLTFDQIDFPANARPTNATDIAALVSSIRAIGLQVPLTVVERAGRYLLVAGRHRLDALRVIGEERGRSNVCALISAGEIKASKLGKRVLIARSEATALLERNAIKPEPADD